MKTDIIRSVFSGESIDYETFEKRLGEEGFGIEEINAEERSALEKELEYTRNEWKIELSLARNRAKNIKAARAMLDESELFDEKGLSDERLSEQTQRLREENPWLFEEDAPKAKSVSTFLPQSRAVLRDPSQMSDDEYYKNIMKGENK